MGNRKFTSEQYERAEMLMKEGKGYKVAAEMTGISESTLRRKISAHACGQCSKWASPKLVGWAVKNDFWVNDFASLLSLPYTKTHARLRGTTQWRSDEIEILAELTGLTAEEITAGKGVRE